MLSLLAVTVAVSFAAQAPTWPPIDDAIAATGGGDKDAAVVVGVTDYYDLPKIAGAADNASAWAQYLMQVRKVPSSRVVTLRDRDATRERILSSARTMASQVKPGGTLWFVFIGHGAPGQSGTDGLLLGADTQPDGESLTARGVPQEELLKILATGAQAETLAIFDACFSGKSSDGEASLVAGLQATLPNRRVASAAQKKATILASSDTWAGPLPGMARPAFSFLLLGALRGWGDENGDKKVGLQEAFDFTKDTMQGVMKTANRLPSMRGQTSARLVVPARAARPDVASLVAGRCPSGWLWEGARCKEAPKVECPAGTSWNGSACVSLCPAGTAWNGRACAATVVECPAGTTWNGSACEGARVAVASQPTGNDGARRAGEARRDDKGITWVWMPSGSFHLGCEPQDSACDSDEKPGSQRQVDGFWMAQTETTVAAYQACVRAGACAANQLEGDFPEKTCNAPNNRAQHPMNCVDWESAGSFCRWAGGRLPTAVEWEYAAKSGSSRVYPWGNEGVTGRRANFCDSNCPTALSEANKKLSQEKGWVTLGEDDGWAATAPVGSFGRGDTPWGLKDMAGNVFEWTASNYESSNKELRGGSWLNTPANLRASYRSRFEPAKRDDVNGFRCAQ
jgi:formylglycine-generating enzyme required for sulfatase activity